jgi:hypothetical protein
LTKQTSKISEMVDLNYGSKKTSSPQSDFMLLPLTERRQIMAKQADQMWAHYQQSQNEHIVWQAGDFIDEY